MFAPEDIEAAFALFPHRMGEWLAESALAGMPVIQSAYGPIQIIDETVAAVPAGMQDPADQERLGTTIQAASSWRDGAWELVLVRPLAQRGPTDVSLEPGACVAVNFAIWNGAARDMRGQKSVTIWHELEHVP
ncbi:MAG: hypothetical protein GY711_10065 [bacterium]|nr:hypothetical protein [bacterium]